MQSVYLWLGCTPRKGSVPNMNGRIYSAVPGRVGIHSSSSLTSSTRALSATSLSKVGIHSLSALLFILTKLSRGRNMVTSPFEFLYALSPSKMP